MNFKSMASFWIRRFNTPNPPCFLGRQIMSQAAKELHLTPESVFLRHKHWRLILSNYSTIFGGNLIVPIAKIGSEVMTELARASFPA